MPTSESDLDKKRARIAKLREQVADEQVKVTVNAQEQSNAIEAAQLDAEIAKLDAQLKAAKEATKKSVAQEGASNTLNQVTAELEAAQQPVTPPGVAVDTNKDADKAPEKKDGE